MVKNSIKVVDLLDIDATINIKSNSRAKGVNIKYEKDAVTIVKPTRLSYKRLYEILLVNKSKIKSDYDKFLLNYNEKKISILNKDKILYNGKDCELKITYVEDNIVKLKFENDVFNIIINKNIDEKNSEKLVQKLLNSFYKQQTYNFLQDEIVYWSNATNIQFNKFSVRNVKTRWGSCVKATKSLNFNLKLSMLPKYVRSSIIVHELCHIKEANHGENFWKLVYNYIPNYDECKKWLKLNNSKLIF